MVEGQATFIYGAGRYTAGAGNIVSFPGSSPTEWRTRPTLPVSLIAVCSVSYW